MAFIRKELLLPILMAALGLMVYYAGYVTGKGAVALELAQLQGRVQQGNEEASARLREVIAQRDAEQARRERLAKEQEKKDEDAQAEIDRLAGELERRPVRVRIVTTPAGACSGSAGGDAAADTGSGSGDSASAYGVLPPENTRRLDAALIEVEKLSRAYNSCRARLIN
jgi:hypothetical protein